MHNLLFKEGYRFLRYGETLLPGDEFYLSISQVWTPTRDVGKVYQESTSPLIYRRKITQEDTMEIEISRDQFKAIYNVVCEAWQKKLLAEYNFSVQDTIKVNSSVVLDQLKRSMATADQTKKIKKILNIKEDYPKKGTLLLIRSGGAWTLRFSEGNGNYYTNQRKTGTYYSLDGEEYMVFDANNLPQDLVWDVD